MSKCHRVLQQIKASTCLFEQLAHRYPYFLVLHRNTTTVRTHCEHEEQVTRNRRRCGNWVSDYLLHSRLLRYPRRHVREPNIILTWYTTFNSPCCTHSCLLGSGRPSVEEILEMRSGPFLLMVSPHPPSNRHKDMV